MDFKKVCLNVIEGVTSTLIVTAILFALEDWWRWIMSVFWIKYLETTICFMVFTLSMFLWTKFFPRFSYFSLNTNQGFYDGNQKLAVLLEEIDHVLSYEGVSVIDAQTQGVAFYLAYVKRVKNLMKKIRRFLPGKDEPLNIVLKSIYSELSLHIKDETLILQNGKERVIHIIHQYEKRICEAKMNLARRYPMIRLRQYV